MAIQRIRIKGTSPHDRKVFDADTGEKIFVRSIELAPITFDGLMGAKVGLVVASLEIEALVGSEKHVCVRCGEEMAEAAR